MIKNSEQSGNGLGSEAADVISLLILSNIPPLPLPLNFFLFLMHGNSWSSGWAVSRACTIYSSLVFMEYSVQAWLSVFWRILHIVNN